MTWLENARRIVHMREFWWGIVIGWAWGLYVVPWIRSKGKKDR